MVPHILKMCTCQPLWQQPIALFIHPALYLAAVLTRSSCPDEGCSICRSSDGNSPQETRSSLWSCWLEGTSWKDPPPPHSRLYAFSLFWLWWLWRTHLFRWYSLLVWVYCLISSTRVKRSWMQGPILLAANAMASETLSDIEWVLGRSLLSEWRTKRLVRRGCWKEKLDPYWVGLGVKMRPLDCI